MTVNEVKENLPDVKIEFMGKLYTGKVRGRKNQFASVIVESVDFEFSWETVTRAINNDSCLLV